MRAPNSLAQSFAWALLPLLALGLTTAGCANECQQLCDEMADYATECDLEWDREAIKDCKSNQANRNFEDPSTAREACADALPTVRDEWTCDDLEDYFDQEEDDGESSESEE
jgi:hypothetical protein